MKHKSSLSDRCYGRAGTSQTFVPISTVRLVVVEDLPLQACCFHKTICLSSYVGFSSIYGVFSQLSDFNVARLRGLQQLSSR